MSESESNKPPVVFYHAHCYDGFGAALAAWLKFGDRATYAPYTWNASIDLGIRENAVVYFLDICPPRGTIDALHARNVEVFVIDHHPTSKAVIAGLDPTHFLVADGVSGALLAHRFFQGQAALSELHLPFDDEDEFFAYISDRDLWQFKLEGSREFHASLEALPWDFETWTDHFHDIAGMIDRGYGLLALQKQLVENMCARAGWAVLGKERLYIPIANATVLLSEVANRLLELYPNAKAAAYYLVKSDGRVQWGLRSRSAVECKVNDLAKQYGGGGHDQSAGFETTHGILSVLLAPGQV